MMDAFEKEFKSYMKNRVSSPDIYDLMGDCRHFWNACAESLAAQHAEEIKAAEAAVLERAAKLLLSQAEQTHDGLRFSATDMRKMLASMSDKIIALPLTSDTHSQGKVEADGR